MRVIALIFVATMSLFVASPGHALAEKVKTNQSTKLYARPGEQAKVLLTVKPGQNMTLIGKDGRWLKVRVNGRTGYVPRSKVDMADDGEIARNTRRRPFVDGRSKRRGFGGDAPEDRVAADAVGEGQEDEDKEPEKIAKKSSDDEDEDDEDDKPAPKKAPEKKVAKVDVKKAAPKDNDEEDEDDDADDDEDEDKPAPKKTAAKEEDDEEEDEGEENAPPTQARARVTKKQKVFEDPDEDSEDLFIARPTDTLFALETKGSWTKVENSEGDAGWIQTSDLQIEGGGGGGGGFGKKQLDVRARMGLMFIQQGMRTAGSMTAKWPDNYNLGVSSVMVSLGGGILVPRGNKLLGGEITYDIAKTLLGGVYFDTDTDQVPGTNIGLTFHNFNARLFAGIDFKKKSGMALFGRLGYHYQGYLVTDVTSMTANPAKLPSETVKGPTIGAALSLPTFTQKIGLRFDLDTILFGASVNQTLGLQDGTSPSVKAVDAGITATYHWKKAMDLQLAYTLHYMGIDFGPPLMSSTRGHMGTDVARTDIFHMISLGIAKPF